jgi:hypothetical protein
MKTNDHKGISLVSEHETSDPEISYWLSEIIYHPTRKFYVTVGFAMFEAQEKDRQIAVRFAPNLELVECFSVALGGESVKRMLSRAKPMIENLIASATGIEPLLFPQEFGIPDSLRFLPPRKFQTQNFTAEIERQYPEFFRELNLFSEKFDCRERKKYGYSFLSRNLHAAFEKFWRHKKLHKGIRIERFVSGIQSLKSIYLGYKSSQYQLFRLLQPVSIVTSTKPAETLASNWPKIQDGLQNELGLKCEMRAIVETLAKDNIISTKARQILKDAKILVDPASALPSLAAQALEALRFA